MTNFAGKLGDFPVGSLKAKEVAGRPVLIANLQGRLFALKDECPHTQQPLSSGYLKGNELVCIFHWAMFNLAEHSVVQGPATSPVPSYEIETRGDDVYVSL